MLYKKNVALLFDMITIILIVLFILNNTFLEIYSYGEIKNVISLVQSNWIYIVLLVIIILIQISLSKRGLICLEKYISDKYVNVLSSLWLVGILILFVFSIDIENVIIVKYLFSILTSIILVLNIRNHGLRGL